LNEVANGLNAVKATKKTATKRRSLDVADTVGKKMCIPPDTEELNPKRSTRTTKKGTNELTPAMKEVMMRKKKVAVSALKSKTKPATGASKVVNPSTRTRRSNK